MMLRPARALARRPFSSDVSSALDAWIAQPKSLVLTDTLTPTHLADLYITLPTRDGSRPGHPYQPPTDGTPLGYGHHLAFFHPRHPESKLRPDGTDADFCPPVPFTRRMWASGTIRWNNKQGSGLRVGDEACAMSTIASVEKKGFDTANAHPMVFVKQMISITAQGRDEPSVVEERSHVYLASRGNRRDARQVTGLPRPDFTFTYKPSLTTLFRFSALTFNGHHIHLDKDYAQHSEGYPERLVHGPLTALMLLEVLQFYKPGSQVHTFKYRARNPVIVNRNSTIYGALTGENKADMWCADDDGVVGMTGSVTFSQ
ncbi:hypothetical protein JVT61DRAFT_12496 [Boletus reticuloceps]|uniref:Mesaconyl-C4 CoA hydratase n=1 Tax=Boletus reticuloceps TaxID=495285 RepID=A0A8I2YDZ6_9AGAM|nr:hypothetical protein JVT61DRAFT_12496 [Boletus reticuloceps]